MVTLTVTYWLTSETESSLIVCVSSSHRFVVCLAYPVIAFCNSNCFGESLIMAATMEHYDGFRTFSWLSNYVGLPIDQVRHQTPQNTVIARDGVASFSHAAILRARFPGSNRELSIAGGYLTLFHVFMHLIIRFINI